MTKQKPKSQDRLTETLLPPEAAWQSPMSWAGMPPQAIKNYSREIPSKASFTRCEAILTVTETVGPGITRQTEMIFPGLIRLDHGSPREVYLSGLDDRCWVYRKLGSGRKSRWRPFAGNTFDNLTEVLGEDCPIQIERMVIQSILPLAGSRRWISFAIDKEGRVENFSAAEDQDPKD